MVYLVKTMLSGWLEGGSHLRAEWRYATMVYGAPCVMTSGKISMLTLCADI